MQTPKYLEAYIPADIDLLGVGEYIFRVTPKTDYLVRKDFSHPLKFLIITGMSGAGKTSICETVMSINPEFVKVKTSTTRPRRPEEESDQDPYFRFSVEEFKASLDRGEILEYSEYADHYYFTRNDSVSNILAGGKNPMVIVDPKGSNFYKDLWESGTKFSESVSMTRLFVIPPSIEVMRDRLIARSQDPSLAERRIAQSFEDVRHVFETDYVVINETGKLDEVARQIMELVL